MIAKLQELKMHLGAVSIAAQEHRAFSMFKKFSDGSQSRVQENWFKILEPESGDAVSYAYHVR